jgi:hypothetical protein
MLAAIEQKFDEAADLQKEAKSLRERNLERFPPSGQAK